MAERVECKAVVDESLALQREMYAGGDVAAVWELLAEDVVWHVPGTSQIAGDYAGRDSVVIQLGDGRARLGGGEVVRRPAGVYRVADGRIAEAWLIPLDQQHFDRVWAATRRVPFVYIQRVRRSARRARCSATVASSVEDSPARR